MIRQVGQEPVEVHADARYAALVGRERVIAGSDCGFGTSAVWSMVDPAIAWAKLASLVEGARLASTMLWGG